jgi:hypothetical protein
LIAQQCQRLEIVAAHEPLRAEPSDHSKVALPVFVAKPGLFQQLPAKSFHAEAVMSREICERGKIHRLISFPSLNVKIPALRRIRSCLEAVLRAGSVNRAASARPTGANVIDQCISERHRLEIRRLVRIGANTVQHFAAAAIDGALHPIAAACADLSGPFDVDSSRARASANRPLCDLAAFQSARWLTHEIFSS